MTEPSQPKIETVDEPTSTESNVNTNKEISTSEPNQSDSLKPKPLPPDSPNAEPLQPDSPNAKSLQPDSPNAEPLPPDSPKTGGRKRRKTKRRKTHRKGKKSKKKRTKAGKTKKTRTNLNSPIISRHARSLRHRTPSFTGASLRFRRRRR
jgi:hypothetical protein